MNIQININGDNAAFEDNTEEFSRILHKLAEEMREYPYKAHGAIRDINGNTCGTCIINS